VQKRPLLKRFQFAIKLLALVAVLAFVYLKIKGSEEDFGEIKQQLQGTLGGSGALYWAFVVLLLPLNWLLEAKKWQLAAASIEKISLSLALRGVLSGLALGFITPHAWGDYAGRIWHMKNAQRHHALAGVLMSRASQMAITLVAGMPGLFFLLQSGEWLPDLPPALLQVLVLLSALLLLTALLRVGVWVQKLATILGRYSWFAYLQPLEGFSPQLSARLLLLSALRYLVFSSQFILMLFLFKVDLPLGILAMGVGFVYLAKSVIPAFNFLSDLGVREFSALLFFSSYEVSAALIVLASLVLWLINILLPTIAGAFLIFKARILLKQG
jgi:uncharacterized membrane protein YbhN (UPF0104 family)